MGLALGGIGLMLLMVLGMSLLGDGSDISDLIEQAEKEAEEAQEEAMREEEEAAAQIIPLSEFLAQQRV